MTHFSDGVETGGAITNPIIGSSGGFGVKNSPSFTYSVIPLTKNAANIAASQSPAAAAIVLTAGTGVTAAVDTLGVTRYMMDVPRAVTITSGGNDTGIQFLIRGYDTYGAPMSQLLTGASGGVATTTKAFASVISITPTGAVASTVTAGTADVFGLPVAVLDSGYISALGWASPALPAIDNGTLILGVTTSATSSTGDVRGTYTPSSASNGVRRLVVEILYSALQISANPNASSTSAILGVTQA